MPNTLTHLLIPSLWILGSGRCWVEAASLGKHVLWVRYWVISSSEEAGGKTEAGGRRGIPPPHTNIDAYTNTTYITTLCHVTLYTNTHNTHGFWGGCSYSGSPASSIVTARQVYRVLWDCLLLCGYNPTNLSTTPSWILQPVWCV